MRKLSTRAKMVEMAIYVLFISTPIMAGFELWFLKMYPGQVAVNRIAQGVLNASALLGQDYVKLAAGWMLTKVEKLFGVSLRRFGEGTGSLSEAWRTVAAISELVFIQSVIYLPTMLLLGADQGILFVGMTEIISGCIALWLYHRGYESYVMPAVRSLRRTLRRAERIRQQFTQGTRHGLRLLKGGSKIKKSGRGKLE